jgi:hypothetical protein
MFIKEKIGKNELSLMLPKDKVPIISSFNYDKNKDTFEIYFKKHYDYKSKIKNGVEFLEDNFGHLMAIRILYFSKLDVDSIKLNILASIKNEIEQVSMELRTKNDILDNVIDKRKLMFLDNLVKYDYKVIKKELLNNLAN